MAPSGQALDKDEVREIVQTALNSGSGDAEWSALVEIGEMCGLEYDEESGAYK